MMRSVCLAALFVVALAELEEAGPLFDDTGMHCKGSGITDLMQWDHAQCSAYCSVREDCYGYVFNIKTNFSCILKSNSCQMKSSEVWRFFKKPGAPAHVPGGNSDWNADPPPPVDEHGLDPLFSGYQGEMAEVVNGPPGNVGDSFTKRDFHCAGKNMGNGEPWSLGECAAQCLRNDKCIGFVRLITGDQQCILKEAGCAKKPPTVWVFYEKTTNGEVWPEAAAAVSANHILGPVDPFAPFPPIDANLPPPVAPVAADAAGFGSLAMPEIDEHFTDTNQHCKGGVISNEMHGNEQCTRACLDAPDCVGYSIAKREPYQCYMKSKECEPQGLHNVWTFVKKKDLFREMRAVRCIKFAEEYGATSAEQCKQMCLERESFCVGVSYRAGSCKLITSFDCGGWQIFKKLAEGGGPPSFIPQAWAPTDFQHDTAIPIPHDAMMDFPSIQALGGDVGLQDAMPLPDILLYFHKLNGNCRGGTYLDDVWGSEADCAVKCDKDQRCRGFSYIRSEQRCTLKAESCMTPNVVNPGVSYWVHLQRQ